MNKEEFKEAFGYYPSETFGKSTPKSRSRAKTAKPSSKGTRNQKTNKSASDLEYESLTEDEHQIEVIKWLEANKIYFEASINGLYIPNPHPHGSMAWQKQMRSNQKVLSKQRKLGYRKGIADIKVFFTDIELNIELKKYKGRATPEQLENVERFKSYKYATYEIITGWKDAIDYIKSFMD